MCVYLISHRHDDVMECSQVLCTSHCVPVPRYIDVEFLRTFPAHKVVLCIGNTRVELAVVIAMEGNIEDPVIIDQTMT